MILQNVGSNVEYTGQKIKRLSLSDTKRSEQIALNTFCY